MTGDKFLRGTAKSQDAFGPKGKRQKSGRAIFACGGSCADHLQPKIWSPKFWLTGFWLPGLALMGPEGFGVRHLVFVEN
jgi:hypothetical protein